MSKIPGIRERKHVPLYDEDHIKHMNEHDGVMRSYMNSKGIKDLNDITDDDWTEIVKIHRGIRIKRMN